MYDLWRGYRDSLKNDGYTSYAKYVDAYLKGSFGSGFVYVSPDGQNYIITNRHVVAQAGSASIQFEDSDTGKINKYDDLTVLAADDDIDIAILAFPGAQKPFKAGLTFSTEGIHDGDDVWSEGYPGLRADPVWQLGKGNITNTKVRINDLLDSGISTLIQHSAQVDAGNSGGPLMLISKKDPAGYAIIGMNTWKATYREATNYAIPSQVIINFINRATNSRIKQSDEEIAMPGKSDVLIVGRISVKADEDMQFYAKTRNVNPENLGKDAVLQISASDDSQRQIYTDGEFFFVKYRLPKNRHIQFDSVPYYFFADKKTSLILPLGFSIDVPKDVNYVYIGSFTYNITDDDFTIKNITVSDEYDQAQQLADKITGKKNIELCRVELKAYDEKAVKNKK